MQVKNPLEWRIQKNNESVMIHLLGDLTRDTLLPLWQQRASFLSPKASQHLYWDLKNLQRIDSAGLVLLAELLHCYQKNPNYLINTPDAIKSLVELFDLTEWFRPFLYCEYKK